MSQIPNTSHQAAPGQTAKSYGSAFRAYRQEIWRLKQWSLPGLLLPGIGAIFVTLIPPLVIAKLIRDFHGHIPSTWHQILPYIVVMAGAWLFGEFIYRIAFLCLDRSDSYGMEHLYVTAMRELLKKDLAFFNDNFAGSLTKKAIGYGRGYEGFCDTLAFNIFGNLVPLLFSVVVLWHLAPLLVVVMVGIIGTTFAVITPAVKQRRRLVAIREMASNTMAGHIADVISNIAAVQAFAHEPHEQRRHNHLVKDYTDKARHTWDFHVYRVDSVVAAFSVAANAIGLIVAILLGHSAQSTATIFIAFSYFSQSTRILFEFNRIYRNIENALTEAAEFTALLETVPKLQERPDAKALHIDKGEIRFEQVDFAYDDDNRELLFQNFNLSVKAGEKIALVGHSGGGKTTVTKLLLHFVELNGGRITIDGQDIANGTLASLRHNIAYVPQDPAMFHRSIADNIRYGKLDASDEAIVTAAQQAHATEFVAQLPEGFETLIGERGVKLSGGQRQRIAIARAMLKNAPILVLDEATSALDSESEILIQDALWKLMDGRTAIVIAHRLSTIQKMDRIIVLDQGQIVEQGSHHELIKHKGTYAKLWAHQSGGFIDD